jgi:hypothetical protein
VFLTSVEQVEPVIVGREYGTARMVIDPQSGDQCTITNEDNQDFVFLTDFLDDIVFDEQEFCYNYTEN